MAKFAQLTKVSDKILGYIVIYCGDFPSSCPIDVLSSEMDSQVHIDNFQLFPVTKEVNLGKENAARKFDVFCKVHSYT